MYVNGYADDDDVGADTNADAEILMTPVDGYGWRWWYADAKSLWLWGCGCGKLSTKKNFVLMNLYIL